jgi:hypothetical protein
MAISALVAVYDVFERTPAQPAVGGPEQVPELGRCVACLTAS